MNTSNLISIILMILSLRIAVIYYYNNMKNVIEIKKMNKEESKKGMELYKILKNNSLDTKKIFGEMFFISEQSSNWYEEYEINMKNHRRTLGDAIKFLLIPSSIFKSPIYIAQNKLLDAMNHNIKAEWTPRLQLLKENKESFYDNNELHKLFIELCKLDSIMQKLTINEISKTNSMNDIRRVTKVVGGIASVAAIVAIPIVGGAIKNYSREMDISSIRSNLS